MEIVLCKLHSTDGISEKSSAFLCFSIANRDFPVYLIMFPLGNTALEYVKGIHCQKAHTRLGTLEVARKKGIIPSLQMKLIPVILQLYLPLHPASHN